MNQSIPERAPMRRQRKQPGAKKPLWREIVEWVVLFAGAYLLATLISTYIFQIIPVMGESMTPTLQSGERMFVTKFTYYFREPERHEIVITHYPESGDLFVKRVVGLPGETIGVHDGQVYIDGEPLEEPYTREDTIYYEMEDTVIPEGYVFVMGDNRNDSKDSHSSSVGPLPLSDLVGKAQFVIWPLNAIRSLRYTPQAG